MSELPTILITEDDDGHAFLMEDNLRRAGVGSPVQRFVDGQEVLDFLFGQAKEPEFDGRHPYLLLLDIRLPKVDGVAVQRQIKADRDLHKLPVIMVTTTDDPGEVDRCHALGCNAYIQKPVSYQSFSDVMIRLGQFVALLQLPQFSNAVQDEQALLERR
ncbi:MAG: response regulator [Chthoniobacter sp.]|nr:response regulator [Chthoniobacter sp.]